MRTLKAYTKISFSLKGYRKKERVKKDQLSLVNLFTFLFLSFFFSLSFSSYPHDHPIALQVSLSHIYFTQNKQPFTSKPCHFSLSINFSLSHLLSISISATNLLNCSSNPNSLILKLEQHNSHIHLLVPEQP